MLQYSVYARVCNGNDAVTKHRARLTGQLPANGAVRLLVVTEKQYQSIEILLGPFSPADTPFGKRKNSRRLVRVKCLCQTIRV